MDPYHGGYRDERPMIVDPREVEQFITDNNLDERAGDDLRGCPPEVRLISTDNPRRENSSSSKGPLGISGKMYSACL